MKNTMLEFFKDHIYIILGGLCIVIIGVIYIVLRLQPGRQILPQDIIYDPLAVVALTPVTETPPAQETEEPAEVVRTIIVHIVGEVNRPGVYELTDGSRVYDVLQMAGGGTAYADLSRINLASFLRDAMQIIVPAVGEDIDDVFIYDDTAQTPADNAPAQAGGRVNINTATAAELQTLPGVGAVTAGNIISFRESHGNFASVDELMNVPRIGQATLDRLRDLITVGN